MSLTRCCLSPVSLTIRRRWLIIAVQFDAKARLQGARLKTRVGLFSITGISPVSAFPIIHHADLQSPLGRKGLSSALKSRDGRPSCRRRFSGKRCG
jgi:hypothetical protein